jgi:hypothetical protein
VDGFVVGYIPSEESKVVDVVYEQDRDRRLGVVFLPVCRPDPCGRGRRAIGKREFAAVLCGNAGLGIGLTAVFGIVAQKLRIGAHHEAKDDEKSDGNLAAVSERVTNNVDVVLQKALGELKQ